MNIEYEATFKNIDINSTKEKLEQLGAVNIYKRFLQKRTTFNLPLEEGNEWVRVREEYNKVTMTYKKITGIEITDQKEVEIIVNDYNESILLLEAIKCKKKSFQETYRELWELDGVQITIDEWPFLEPLIEIEGVDEYVVKEVSEKLGFIWSEAIFDSVSCLYSQKYNLDNNVINNHTPKIVFNMKNPFVS